MAHVTRCQEEHHPRTARSTSGPCAWLAVQVAQERPTRKTRLGFSTSPPRGLRPRLLLASAPRMPNGNQSKVADRVLVGEIRRQPASRRFGDCRIGESRLARRRDLGMRDTQTRASGSRYGRANPGRRRRAYRSSGLAAPMSSADTRFKNRLCRPSGAKRAASMWSPMTRNAWSP